MIKNYWENINASYVNFKCLYNIIQHKIKFIHYYCYFGSDAFFSNKLSEYQVEYRKQLLKILNGE